MSVSPSMEGQNRVKSFQDKRKGAPEEVEKLGSQENNGAVPPFTVFDIAYCKPHVPVRWNTCT